MGLDLDKMREKLNKLQNKNPGSDVFWRPQDGEQTLRIVPTKDGDPFKDFWFHYNVGNNPGFLSPKKNFGQQDPLDNFVRKLFNDGDEESIKMAKSLSARQRFFSPVLVRGEEEKGVRIWGYGKQVYEKLLNLVLNPEYGDITDPETGTDLVINYGKPAGAQFPQTGVTPRRKSSVLCDDAVGGSERCAELLDNIPEFESLFNKKSPEEVGQLLDEFLLSQSDAESVSSETSKFGNDSGTSSTTTSSKSTVDGAFDDLMKA